MEVILRSCGRLRAVIEEVERFMASNLIILGAFLMLAGVLLYLLPHVREFKLAENPLIIFPLIKGDNFLVGFSPLMFLVLLILYLLCYIAGKHF